MFSSLWFVIYENAVADVLSLFYVFWFSKISVSIIMEFMWSLDICWYEYASQPNNVQPTNQPSLTNDNNHQSCK